ncbi:MAG: hypothetical protein OXC41_09440 [Gammaproteobacteria bacterium]|nr:hypothetical protein [Gammaproteobacteria bacterium]
MHRSAQSRTCPAGRHSWSTFREKRMAARSKPDGFGSMQVPAVFPHNSNPPGNHAAWPATARLHLFTDSGRQAGLLTPVCIAIQEEQDRCTVSPLEGSRHGSIVRCSITS